jgi:hypothetical protein
LATGIGEFTPARSHTDQTKIRTRLLFLEEIQTTAIEVLESLRDEVFDPFRKVLPVYSDVSNDLHNYADRVKIAAWLTEHPGCRVSVDRLASICLAVTIDGPGGVARLEAYARDLVYAMRQGHSQSLSDRDLALIRDLIILDEPKEGGLWHTLRAADENCHAELVPLRTAIFEWSRKYNLDGDWWRNIALRTVNDWSASGECDLEFYWSMAETREIDHAAELALLPYDEFPRWEPANQRRRDYRNGLTVWARGRMDVEILFKCTTAKLRTDLIDLVEKKGKSYCDSVEVFYESNGWTRVKDKRSLLKHIKWTVAFQVQKLSHNRIAQSFGVGVGPVKRAVDEVLNLIELPARPPKLLTALR